MNALLHWLLQRMAANPATVFWERDLAERFPDAFAEAQRTGLVRRAPAAEEGDLYDRLPGPVLTIMAEGDEFVGTDEDDPEHMPASLTELDLQRCRLNLDSFAHWFKRKHGFDGTLLQVHPRFYQLGEITRERTAVLLGLVLPTPQGADLMAALPAFLSTPFERYLVLCPGGAFGITETRLLQGRGIVTLPLGEDFEVNVRDALGPPPRVRPAVMLTAVQKEEAQRRSLQARFSIEITGERKGTRDIMLLDGQEVGVQATPFRQLLRLIIGLCETEQGWVLADELALLAQDPGNKPQSYEQLVSRIRDPFRSSLQGLEPTQFIEHAGGRVRLSVHPACISCAKAALGDHPMPQVTRLVERLEAARARFYAVEQAAPRGVE